MPSSTSWPSWPSLSTSSERVVGEPPLKRTSQSTRSPGSRPPPSAKRCLPASRSAKTLPPAEITSCLPSWRTTEPRTWVPRALPSRRTVAPEYVPSGSFEPLTTTVLPTRNLVSLACSRTVRTVPSVPAVTSALRAASFATIAPRKVAAPAVAGSTTASAALATARSSRYRFMWLPPLDRRAGRRGVPSDRLVGAFLSAAVGRQPHSCSSAPSAAQDRYSRGIPPPSHHNRGMFGGLLRQREIAEHGPERHQQDLDVEPERPVLDVVVVPLGAVGERGLAAQAVNLGPAGDPGLDAVAVAVAVDVVLEQPGEVRTLGTWADQAHVALEHVQQLRQLVERGAAQERAEARAAVVGLDPAGRGVGRKVGQLEWLGGRAHRAELPHLELAPVEAIARLPEEDRPADGQQCPHREQGEERQRDEQQQPRDEAVDRVLDRELPAFRVGSLRRQERQAAEVIDRQALGPPLEQPRHERDRNAELLAALDLTQQDLARRRGEGDHDVLDPVLLDQALEIPARTEDGHRQGRLVER